jgi:hypothetical protein
MGEDPRFEVIGPRAAKAIATMDEMDEALKDCVKRAANRAEHIRLTRLQVLLARLRGEIGEM